MSPGWGILQMRLGSGVFQKDMSGKVRHPEDWE